MSNSHLFMTAVYPRAPLSNGIGRFVCQLQRVTLKYCKGHGSSQGVRGFLEHDLVNFANDNPGVVVYVKPRRHRLPVICAEYLNGQTFWICCKDYKREEVVKWMELVRTQVGHSSAVRLYKLFHTENPSIQGPWTPFTSRDPANNLTEFPNKKLGTAVKLYPTATQQLLDIFKAQQESKS